MAKLKLIEARVLTAIHALGVEANHVLQATVAHIKALEAAGLVDSNPDAVAYVKSINAPVKTVEATAAVDEISQAATGMPPLPEETEQPPASNGAPADAEAAASGDVQTSGQPDGTPAEADSAKPAESASAA